MDKLGRYLDPMIVVRSDEGKYWTPNGNHRLAALRELGARSVVAIVVPDIEVAHRTCCSTTRRRTTCATRSLEVIRLAELLAETESRPERDYEIEFEEPALLTLGLCYRRTAASPAAPSPDLRRGEKFFASALRRR